MSYCCCWVYVFCDISWCSSHSILFFFFLLLLLSSPALSSGSSSSMSVDGDQATGRVLFSEETLRTARQTLRGEQQGADTYPMYGPHLAPPVRPQQLPLHSVVELEPVIGSSPELARGIGTSVFSHFNQLSSSLSCFHSLSGINGPSSHPLPK